MSFDTCINNDLLGVIMQLVDCATLLTMAQTCLRMKRRFMALIKQDTSTREGMSIYACRIDEIWLFQLCRGTSALIYWHKAVHSCSLKIMKVLLHEINPNTNNNYALVILCRSKHEMASEALKVLIGDPRTNDCVSGALNIATCYANAACAYVLMKDSRFTSNHHPSQMIEAAIRFNIALTSEWCENNQYLCERYFHNAVESCCDDIVQTMLPYVPEWAIKQQAHAQTNRNIGLMIRDELKRRDDNTFES